ncbi:c-type cytochrome [Paenibacillus koleovorans]|uniref:c-type cytochrome n=1 Tax=Paenibacillus koleovorans TaxID=121608 RepID=UPI000FDB3A08|nr:cytochrome c [Paenibacillus koleovorans]
MFFSRTRNIWFVAALGLTLSLTACGGSTSKEQAGKPELLSAAPATVQTVYKKSCLSCHGDGLQGRIGPKTDLTQVGARMTSEQIETQIRKGGSGMPAFQNLKPEEITAIRDWLSGLK